MILSAIITSALAQLDRGSAEPTIAKYRDKFTTYANEAQQDLAKDFPLFRTDPVTLTNGAFLVSSLPRWALKINKIMQNGEDVTYDIGSETGEIVCDATGTVDVTYQFLPKPLQDVSDTPDLPEQTHQCIVTYVVARERGTGDPTTRSGSTVDFQIYQSQKRGLMKMRLGVPSSYTFKNV